jgi:hypothetical protein
MDGLVTAADEDDVERINPAPFEMLLVHRSGDEYVAI